MTAIATIQSHRTVDYDTSSDLPHQIRPVVISHPRTDEPLLYVGNMQTTRIVGMDREHSDATLDALFRELYREDRIYRHNWNNGDLVIWDNIALQHSRGDLTGMTPRQLQRIVVADKSFSTCCLSFRWAISGSKRGVRAGRNWFWIEIGKNGAANWRTNASTQGGTTFPSSPVISLA